MHTEILHFSLFFGLDGISSLDPFKRPKFSFIDSSDDVDLKLSTFIVRALFDT